MTRWNELNWLIPAILVEERSESIRERFIEIE